MFWAALALGLFAAGHAQIVSTPHHVAFAEGSGILTNPHTSLTARFAFAVRKVDDNPAEGRFEFGTFVPEHGHVAIRTDHINELVVDHNQAWFGGPAGLVLTDLHGVAHEFHGHLRVHVSDNVFIGEGEHRHLVDVLDLRFVSEDGSLVYEFAGITPPENIHVGVHTG